MRFAVNDALWVGEILLEAAQAEIKPRFGRLTAGLARSAQFEPRLSLTEVVVFGAHEAGRAPLLGCG